MRDEQVAGGRRTPVTTRSLQPVGASAGASSSIEAAKIASGSTPAPAADAVELLDDPGDVLERDGAR